MVDGNAVAHRGVRLGGITTILFVVAKVFEIGPVAKWSWWTVFVIPLASVTLSILLIVFLIALSLARD